MGAATETAAASLVRTRRRRPGEPSPREINREQRFEQILHAAYVCFTKKGFHSTSMSDIAREAGVSVGHLYNFFESRDDKNTRESETREICASVFPVGG